LKVKEKILHAIKGGGGGRRKGFSAGKGNRPFCVARGCAWIIGKDSKKEECRPLAKLIEKKNRVSGIPCSRRGKRGIDEKIVAMQSSTGRHGLATSLLKGLQSVKVGQEEVKIKVGAREFRMSGGERRGARNERRG